MDAQQYPSPTTRALYTLAAIKAATDDFERGDANVLDTLDEIVAAVETFRAAAPERTCRKAA